MIGIIKGSIQEEPNLQGQNFVLDKAEKKNEITGYIFHMLLHLLLFCFLNLYHSLVRFGWSTIMNPNSIRILERHSKPPFLRLKRCNFLFKKSRASGWRKLQDVFPPMFLIFFIQMKSEKLFWFYTFIYANFLCREFSHFHCVHICKYLHFHHFTFHTT